MYLVGYNAEFRTNEAQITFIYRIVHPRGMYLTVHRLESRFLICDKRKKHIPMESCVISLDKETNKDSQSLDIFYIVEDRGDKCMQNAYRTLKGDDVNGRYYRNSSAFREKGMHPSSFPPFRPFSTAAVSCPGSAGIVPLTEIPAFAYQGNRHRLVGRFVTSDIRNLCSRGLSIPLRPSSMHRTSLGIMLHDNI